MANERKIDESVAPSENKARGQRMTSPPISIVTAANTDSANDQPPPQPAGRRNSQGTELYGAFVGSFEESLLSGRMSTPPSKPIDFLCQIGCFSASSSSATSGALKCPPHVTIPFMASFYHLSRSVNSAINSSNSNNNNNYMDSSSRPSTPPPQATPRFFRSQTGSFLPSPLFRFSSSIDASEEVSSPTGNRPRSVSDLSAGIYQPTPQRYRSMPSTPLIQHHGTNNSSNRTSPSSSVSSPTAMRRRNSTGQAPLLSPSDASPTTIDNGRSPFSSSYSSPLPPMAMDSYGTPYVGLVDLDWGLGPSNGYGYLHSQSPPTTLSHTHKQPTQPISTDPPGTYRIPPKGQLQILIRNPQHRSVVRIFLVPYDLRHVKEERTYIRQKYYQKRSSNGDGVLTAKSTDVTASSGSHTKKKLGSMVEEKEVEISIVDSKSSSPSDGLSSSGKKVPPVFKLPLSADEPMLASALSESQSQARRLRHAIHLQFLIRQPRPQPKKPVLPSDVITLDESIVSGGLSGSASGSTEDGFVEEVSARMDKLDVSTAKAASLPAVGSSSRADRSSAESLNVDGDLESGGGPMSPNASQLDSTSIPFAITSDEVTSVNIPTSTSTSPNQSTKLAVKKKKKSRPSGGSNKKPKDGTGGEDERRYYLTKSIRVVFSHCPPEERFEVVTEQGP